MRTELIWEREKMKEEGVWLQPGDVTIDSRHNLGIGGETRYYFTRIGTSFHLSDEILNLQTDRKERGCILKEMELEALMALQAKIEEIVIGKMLNSAVQIEDNLLPTSVYIPQRGQNKFYLRSRLRYFPSRYVKPEEVLAIVNPESYANLYRLITGGENPEAIVGKIKWLTPWFDK